MRWVWLAIFLLATAVILTVGTVGRQRLGAPGPGAGPAPGGAPAGDYRTGMVPSTAPRLAPAWTYDAGAPFEAAPVAAGGRVFAVTQEGTLHALDGATGRLLWRYRPAGRRVWDGAVAVAGDTVLAGVEGGALVALDAAGGRLRWERRLTGEVRFAPAPAGDAVYVATTFVGPPIVPDRRGRGRVYALRPGDGSTIWERVTDNFSLRAPVAAGDTVYVGGGFEGPYFLEEGGWFRLYALAARDGAVRWTFEGPYGFVKSLHATPEAVAFVGYADELVGLDAASGRVRWRYHTENWTDGFGAAGERLWFGSANGFIHALAVADGRRLWRERLDGVFKYPEGPPVFHDGQVFFRTTYAELYAMDADTGAVRWRRHVGVEARSSPAVDGERVYVAGVDGRVYAYPRPR